MLFALDICVNKKAPPTHSVQLKKLQPPEKGHPLPSFFVCLLFDKKYFIHQPSFALMNNAFLK